MHSRFVRQLSFKRRWVHMVRSLADNENGFKLTAPVVNLEMKLLCTATLS